MNSGGTTTMASALHFAGGDALVFSALTPRSPGALAGAALVLFALALFERWLAAARGVLDARWRECAISAVAAQAAASEKKSSASSASASSGDGCGDVHSYTAVERRSPEPVHVTTHRRPARTVPPCILSADVARGVMHAGQTLLMYTLMLAVMTFQGAYIIAIVAGAGVGELLFGRYNINGHRVASH